MLTASIDLRKNIHMSNIPRKKMLYSVNLQKKHIAFLSSSTAQGKTQSLVAYMPKRDAEEEEKVVCKINREKKLKEFLMSGEKIWREMSIGRLRFF